MRLSIIILLLLLAPAAYAVSYPVQASKDLEELTFIEGIKLHDAHGTSSPTSIPKTWKLITVSNGEKSNANNLWFQDADGSVYLLQGFTSQNKFILHDLVYKIPAK